MINNRYSLVASVIVILSTGDASLYCLKGAVTSILHQGVELWNPAERFYRVIGDRSYSLSI